MLHVIKDNCKCSIFRFLLILNRFIDICNNLVEQVDSELFDSKYLPKLISLHDDKIPNVRQALSLSLGKLLLKGNDLVKLR